MLRSACAWAWSVGTRSAWKLEISSTRTSKALARRPRRAACRSCRRRRRASPAASRIAPTSAVVVLLPLVPPMSAMGAVTKREPSSSSPITSRPDRSKASSAGKRRHAGRDHGEVGAAEDAAIVRAERELARRAPRARSASGESFSRGGRVRGDDARAAIAGAGAPRRRRCARARSRPRVLLVHVHRVTGASSTPARPARGGWR